LAGGPHGRPPSGGANLKSSSAKQSARAATEIAAPDKRGTPEAPVSIKTLPSPDAAAKAAEAKQERDANATADQALVDWTSYLFWVTVILALVAAGQLGLFWWQLRLMRDSVKDAGLAAEAAQKSAEIAEQSLTRLERAFVFPTDTSWVWHLDPGLNKYWYEFRPIWANSGNTVTKNMITNINFALLDAPLPDDFAGRDSDRSYPAMIGPKATVYGGKSFLYADDVVAVQEGRKHFFLWGWARYNDVFEATPVHRTTFCRFLHEIFGDPTKEPNDKDNVVKMRFAIHSSYNDAN
jgi:hypothetical protein